MSFRMTPLLASLLLGVPAVLAQTSTSCNPLTASCPSDNGLAQSSYTVDFTKGADSANWSPLSQWTGAVQYQSDGAHFTVAKQGDSPTILSNWYIFFGSLEVHMKSAPGQGIVSSVVLESDDLDEIDMEWIGGDNANVQTNYFGKGDTTTYDRGGKSPVNDAQGQFHNYTVDWSQDAITWYVDGAPMRTLHYADAKSGTRYPQTPMKLRLGIWAGGDPSNSQGVIDWAGGPTNYGGGPYTMTVSKVIINNRNPAQTYAYGDNSGSYGSIKVGGAGSVSSGSSSSSSSSKPSSSSSTGSSSTTLSTSTTKSGSSTTTTSTSTTSFSAPSGATTSQSLTGVVTSGAPQLATIGVKTNTTTTSTTTSGAAKGTGSSSTSTTSSVTTAPTSGAGAVGASLLLLAAPFVAALI